MNIKEIEFLMEDGAPAHNSLKSQEHKKKKKIKVFLPDKENQSKFFWPGNSPDLNPIENAWASLKAGLRYLKTPHKQNNN